MVAANPEKAAQARAKPSMAGWFVGQVMKATGGKANPGRSMRWCVRSSASTDGATLGERMTYYDYKVIPAPRRAKRMKGVHAPEEMFAHLLTDTINEQARQGWEYLGSETLPAEAPRGWFRRALHEELSVLVFRRQREQLGPRLTAVPSDPVPEAREPLAGAAAAAASERPALDRMQAVFARRDPPKRREPRLDEAGDTPPTPLRAAPRLGPAEKP